MSLVKRHKPNDGQLITSSTTSALQSPTIQLQGHEAEVLCVQYDSSGELIASGSADKSVFLWEAKHSNSNIGVLKGHKGAVLDLKWSRDSRQVFTASSDLTIGIWDLDEGKRIRKHVGHEDMINSIDVIKRGVEMIVSGSDDGTIGVWDPRQKEAVSLFSTEFPILAVAVDSVGCQVYSAGIDNEISAWDARKTDCPLYKLAGHNDANVTGLDVSPDDNFLVSNGMDNTVRTWDIRPFALDDRAVHVYDGAPSSIEQSLHRVRYNRGATRIAAGSGDRTAVVWDAHSCKILYKLLGHIGSVNDVCFSPEGILCSGSSDRTVILYELS